MKNFCLLLLVIFLITSSYSFNTFASSCSCVRYSYDDRNSNNASLDCQIIPNSLELAWKVFVGQYSSKSTNSNVLCYNSKLFLGADDGLLCLDAKDGKTIWTFSNISRIISTPCITNSKIYAGDISGSVKCLTIDGKLVWEGGSTGAIIASPVLYSGDLYVMTDKGLIHNIDPNSNEQNWALQAKAGILSTPAFSGGTMIIGCQNGSLFGVSTTGKQLWGQNDSGPISSSASIYNDRFFIGSEGKTLSCRKISNGDLIWAETFSEKLYSTTAIAKDSVVFGAMDGSIYAYTFDGKKKWSYKTEGGIEGNATISGDYCYFGSNDRNIYVLNVDTGKLVWSYKTNGKVQSSPTVAENSLFVYSSDGYLYCFKEGTKKENKEITKIEVTPTKSECFVGDQSNFTAKAFDKDSLIIEGTTFEWAVNPEDAGTISNEGVFTAKKEGMCIVTATSGGKLGMASVSCKKKIVIAKIDVTPKNITIEAGSAQQFEAKVIDDNGSQIQAKVEWSIMPEEIGIIDGNGMFTASDTPDQAGMIIASYLGKTGTSMVTLMPKIQIDKIVVDPKTATVTPGKTWQFNASAFDKENNLLKVTFDWSCKPPELGKISKDGLFTASSNGNITGMVVASSGGETGLSNVTVPKPKELVDRIELSPKSILLEVGESVNIVAKCYNVSGKEIPADDVQWSLNDNKANIKLSNSIGSNILITGLSFSNDIDYEAEYEIIAKCDYRVSTISVLVVKSKFAYKIHRLELEDQGDWKVTLRIGDKYVIKTKAFDYYNNEIKDYQLVILSVKDDSGNFNKEVNITTNGSEIIVEGSAITDRDILVSVGIKDKESVSESFQIQVLEKYCFDVDKKIISGFVSNIYESYLGSFRTSFCSKDDFDIDIKCSNKIFRWYIKERYFDGGATIDVYVLSRDINKNTSYYGLLSLSGKGVTKEIQMYFYLQPPELQQPRLNYTGWTGMCASASKTSSVPLVDAPVSLKPNLLWQGIDWDISNTSYSPTVWNNKLCKVYIEGDSKGVECYDLKDGSMLWKTENLSNGSGDNIFGPSTYGNYVIVTITNSIIALNLQTGKIVWQWSQSGEVLDGRPVMMLDKVFSGGNHIRCHELKTGKVLWATGTPEKTYTDLGIQSGVLYSIAYGPNNTTIYTIDCFKRNTYWSKNITDPDLLTVFGPNVLLHRYYDSNSDNRLVCRNSKTGSIIWEYTATEPTTWYAVPAVFDIYTVLLNGTKIRCFDNRTGKLLWTKTATGQITSVPVIAGNRVYACVSNLGIYTYDLKTGKLLANPFPEKPEELSEWTKVIPGEGTIIAMYKTYNDKYKLCCYTDPKRFKNVKTLGMEMSVGSKTFAVNNTNSYTNYTLPVTPKIMNNLVYVPTKNILDLTGGRVETTKDKKYILKLGNNTMEVTPNKSKVKLNGKEVSIDPKNSKVTVVLESGIIMLPYGFFAKSMGMNTFWINELKKVIFTYSWFVSN